MIENISNKAKQKMLRLESQAKYPFLIEVTLANGTVYRYANCDEDVSFNDNGVVKTFLAGWFDVNRPEVKNGEIGNGSLVFSAIDEQWKAVIRTQSKRATIRFVATIIYDDNNSIEQVEALEDTQFVLSDVSYNDTTISWTMLFDPIADVTIPCDEATSVKCPSCV